MKIEIHHYHHIADDSEVLGQLNSLSAAVRALTEELKAQRNRELGDLVGTLKDPTDAAADGLKANQ